jgi:septum formation protein
MVRYNVGVYRIEGPGVQLFDRIEGSWFAILGLPLLPLLAFLRGEGLLER